MKGDRQVHRPFRLGLALSGGSLRGAGHLGVLQVLEEHGIVPDIVAGVSAGAVVAALYARGMPVLEMIEKAKHLAKARLIDWDVPLRTVLRFLLRYPLYRLGLSPNPKTLLPPGLIQGARLEAYLHRLFLMYPRRSLPCLISATDLYHTETVVLGSLPSFSLSPGHRYIRLGEHEWPRAVRASCALPGVFQPARLRERHLVDGAVRNTLPADLLFRAGARRVIAVDLHLGELVDRDMKTFIDVVSAAARMSDQSYPTNRCRPDLCLLPSGREPPPGWACFSACASSRVRQARIGKPAPKE